MPVMNSKSFSQLVSDFTAAVQGSSATLLDFTVGSILLAIGNAASAVSVWLESLILVLLQTTRLSTSSGSDVDSFVGDFGLTRQPAVSAEGQVTFARFTPTMQAVIPAGTIVQTADGTETYSVIGDTTQPAWNAVQNAYVIASGTSSANATVQAVTPGTQANVSAGAINTIASAIPYVDTVSNALAFGNGQNAETDAQVRAGFVTFLASLAMATVSAIENAVDSLQVGAACAVTEFQNTDGAAEAGYFYAVVDDGSGAPPATFINKAWTAVNAVRAAGVQFNVYGVTSITANVVINVTVMNGYTPSIVEASLQSAITSYIQSLTMGNACSWSRIAAIAFGVQGVSDVTAWTLNGGDSDLVPTTTQRVLCGSVTVN